jgi:NAD(P)-dependent dehydrogenase (short-subunit alcohol dehydrogenase family)
MRPIEEQTIFVTGATSGLGRELARALAEKGAQVLLHGRDSTRGLETMREIEESTRNGRLQFYRADLSSLQEVEELARQVMFGITRLDVVRQYYVQPRLLRSHRLSAE